MSDNKEHYPFSHFFREGADVMKESSTADAVDQSKHEPPGKKPPLPRLKLTRSEQAEEEEMRQAWMEIRSFYRNGDHRGELPEGLMPVILSRLDPQMSTSDYPLWIPDPAGFQSGWQCSSFERMIRQVLDNMHEEGISSPVLDNQFGRLIHIARDMKGKEALPMHEAMERVFKLFQEQIEVSGEEAEQFAKNMGILREKMPDRGLLLPYSDQVVYYLLRAAIHQLDQPLRSVFRKEVKMMISRLKELVRLNQEKGDDKEPENETGSAASFYDAMVRFNEISAMIPEGGSKRMEKERIERIREIVDNLERESNLLDHLGFISMGAGLPGDPERSLTDIFPDFQILEGDTHPLSGLEKAFYAHIKKAVRFIRALRMGELELNNRYDPDVHDDFFRHFDWANFTEEETMLSGHFILLTSDLELTKDGMGKMMELASASLPVKIIAFSAAPSDNQSDHRDTDTLSGYQDHQAAVRALMMAQKNIYLAQSSLITPEALFGQFRAGLTAPAPALFHLFHHGDGQRFSPDFMASMAIEARDFPGFEYIGLLGTPWGSRFRIEHNPQPGQTWPSHTLEIQNEEDEREAWQVPFTFADKHFLDEGTEPYYFPIEQKYWRDTLVPLHEFLEHTGTDQVGLVPYIWMADATGNLVKVAVSWQVVLKTRERLDFWRFLQENSGIGNYHVTRAVEDLKQAMEKEHAEEIRQLREEHAREIERARDEEADKVMENLTNALMNLDTSSFEMGQKPMSKTAGQDPIKTSPPVDQDAESPGEAPAEPEKDDDLLSMEPYIDTPLCTSCNECIRKNGAMFKYNADKMAYIADPLAGTYKQLVEAAELCPVSIIHPGTPLNPDEEGLEELVKRAEKFN